jgi:hypothetical protein
MENDTLDSIASALGIHRAPDHHGLTEFFYRCMSGLDRVTIEKHEEEPDHSIVALPCWTWPMPKEIAMRFVHLVERERARLKLPQSSIEESQLRINESAIEANAAMADDARSAIEVRTQERANVAAHRRSLEATAARHAEASERMAAAAERTASAWERMLAEVEAIARKIGA